MFDLIIPTLNRYDTLEQCIKSSLSGLVAVNHVYVIDNGGRFDPTPFTGLPITCLKVPHNIGVAAAWNLGILSSRNPRLICNDDVIFEHYTIRDLIEFYNEDTINCLGVNGELNAFSCFTFPESFIDSIGYFDESISPNYAYFEDNDYAYRMKLQGKELYINPSATCKHVGSATLKAMTNEQLHEHHRKFRLARSNYVTKWGGEPGKEVFKTPYNA